MNTVSTLKACLQQTAVAGVYGLNQIYFEIHFSVVIWLIGK